MGILDKLKFSPTDKQTTEVAPLGAEDKSLQLIVRGGDPVRATHPGRVQSIIKIQQFYIVILAATEGGTDLSGRVPSDPNVNLAEFPNTSYAGLGSVNVQVGEKVSQGHELGTVSFFPTTGGPGGQTGITYGVNANGSGSEAAKVAPQGELGIGIVGKANKEAGTGSNARDDLPDKPKPKQDPPDATENDPGLNPSIPENTPTLENVGTSNYPYVSKPQVRFVEQKNQVFSHDLLVFISGVDVTDFLVGSVDINIVDKDGWNEANLTLNNAMNNFVITKENMGFNNDLKGVFRTGQHLQGENKYSEQAKKDLIEYKKKILRNPLVDVASQKLVQAASTQGPANFVGTSKEQQQASSGTARPPVVGQAEGPSGDRGRKDATLVAGSGLQDRRWQLGVMSTVFHKHDPIRIFRKNPIREADEWMPAFTGYLSEISYDTNYVNGQSQVKIACYDIRALAAKMRVQETAVVAPTNPKAIFRGKESAGEASLFTDLLNPTAVGTPLGSERYEDVMEFLITGTSTQSEDLNNAFGGSKFRRGIGDFSLGEKIAYRPGDAEAGTLPDPLEHWHALCLFGTDGRIFRRVDATGDAAGAVEGIVKQGLNAEFDRRYLTRSEAETIGKNTIHDGEWAPHKQYVHMLLPAQGTGAKNLLDYDAANVSSNQIDFRSRLDIMQDFSARIDYQFWVSPMGDFIVEFPQYDFMPEDYGEYNTVFRVDKHLTSDTIQDEAGDMVTAIIAHGRIRPENEAGVNDPVQPKAVVASPMMMMRYGVLEHELSLPFINSASALARIAQIEFQKKLSESNKMNMDFNYRPWITPNRPIEHVERKRMGLTTAVNNSMSVFQEANTGITTRYVRRQLFQPNGRAAYTFIFSGASMPITYRQIYEPSTIEGVSGSARGGVRNATDPIPGADSSGSEIPGVERTLITEDTVKAAKTVETVGTPGRSPIPSSEQVGRFMAMAQQSSGWNPLNRREDGSFGLFGMSKEQRDGLGVGDSTDVTEQTEAADKHFRDLVSKYKGDLDMAVAEFQLGIEKIKNINILEEFKKGFGAVNKKLGAEFEKIAQPLTDGFDVLFPGDTAPTPENAKASEETKEAVVEAETAGAVASGNGFQTTVGVLVFTTADKLATPDTEAGATQTQSEQNVVTNG